MSRIKAVCIGRQYASGGSEIGKLVARKLQVKCYDHEIVDMAIERSGLSKEEFEKYEESVISPLHTPLSFKIGANRQPDIAEKIFQAEGDIICEIADSEPTVVFVGRCADFVLRNRVRTLDVYIYSDMEKRMDKAITKYGISQDEVEQVIKRYDKKRAYFYEANTNKHWGDKSCYDLCIDSGKLGYETTASIIAAIVRASE
ncbi:MAG: cytidylate kinase-like family protein [Ruminococcus sp.]|nr:cytidylate kinase-like family protein [Ruminococcus sp.]